MKSIYYFIDGYGDNRVTIRLNPTMKNSSLVRWLTKLYGEGKKEKLSDDGLSVVYEDAPTPVCISGYLGPTCRITEREVEEEEMETTHRPTGKTILRTVRTVVCD